jgi:hypothetical protein
MELENINTIKEKEPEYSDRYENETELFYLNQINSNNIQICGKISGIATLKEVNGQKRWDFKIKFFKDSKQIIVTSNPKDGTIWNILKLKERIIKAYNE